MTFGGGHRQSMQLRATEVQAELAHHFTSRILARAGQVRWRRVAQTELAENGLHLRGTRALQQQFGDERQPWVLLLAPRIRAEVRAPPYEDVVANAGESPGTKPRRDVDLEPLTASMSSDHHHLLHP